MSRLSDGSEANEVVRRYNDLRESEIRRGLFLFFLCANFFCGARVRAYLRS